MKIYFSYRKFKLAGNKNNTSSMSSIMCLTTMDYLTDEVNTMCILYGQPEKMISGHSSVYGHHYGKSINKLPKIGTLSLHNIGVQL